MERPSSADRFEELLAQRAWVRRVARALVLDGSRADDLEQETWIRALRGPPPRSPRAWLGTILRNAASDMRRGEGRRAAREAAAAPPAPVPTPEEMLERAEVLERVVRAVRTLEEPYRTAVLLRYFEDLPPAAIAARLGAPVETVRTRLRRALAMLRERLDGEGGGDRRKWMVLLLPLARRAVPGLPEGVAGGSALATAWGALAMGMKAKVAVAAVVLLLGAGWWMTRVGEREAGPAAPSGPAAGGGPMAVAGARPARGPSPAEVAAAPAPLAAEPEAARIAGRVVSDGGKPLPGARVTALPLGILAVATITAPGDRKGRGRTVVVDADGRFWIPLPTRDFVLLAAEAEGWASEVRETATPGEEAVLVLRAAKRLLIRVRDGEGRPVAGARVRMMEMLGLLRSEKVSLTDAAGEVRTWMAGPPARTTVSATGLDVPSWETSLAYEPLTAEVRAPGLAPFLDRLFPRVDGDGFLAVVTLATGVRLAGRVLDGKTDRPVPGALVVLWWRSGEGPQDVVINGAAAPDPGALQELLRTRTAEDGTFALDGCPAPPPAHAYPNVRRWTGLLQAGAWKKGRAAAVQDVRPEADGSTGEILLRLVPDARISGRVVDPAGRPVPGAVVASYVPEGPVKGRDFPLTAPEVPGDRGVTDAAGKFVIRGIPVPSPGVPAKVGALVQQPTGSLPRGAYGDVSIDLRPIGETAVGDIVVRPPEGGWVRVRVTGADGRPVWGAIAGKGDIRHQPTATDARGIADVCFYNAEGEQTLVVAARGCAPATVKVVPGPSLEETAEVAVTLGPGFRIAGVVLGADGAPANGAIVWAKDGRVPLEDAFPSDPMTQAKQPALVCFPAITGEDGRFAIEDLPEGPYHLQAGVNLRRGRSLTATLGSVPTGTEDVRLVLPKEEAAPLGEIVVTVADAATGRPVPEAWAFFDARGGRAAGVAVEPGIVRLKDVPSGVGRLQIWAEGYVEAEVPGVVVVAGSVATEARATLDRGAVVTGILRAGEGVTVEDAVVELIPVDRTGWPIAVLRATVRKDGSFRIQGVTPGRYLAQVSRSRNYTGAFLYPADSSRTPLVPAGAQPLTVGPGAGEVRLDLQAAPAGVLVLAPADPRLPIPYGAAGMNSDGQIRFGREARIEVRDVAGRLLVSQEGLGRGFAGVATNLVLPPGAYAVRLALPGDPPREERAVVTEGRTVTVDFK
jgi:RNA polymerase sigma-70 factor (ECF subfamily)